MVPTEEDKIQSGTEISQGSPTVEDGNVLLARKYHRKQGQKTGLASGTKLLPHVGERTLRNQVWADLSLVYTVECNGAKSRAGRSSYWYLKTFLKLLMKPTCFSLIFK